MYSLLLLNTDPVNIGIKKFQGFCIATDGEKPKVPFSKQVPSHNPIKDSFKENTFYDFTFRRSVAIEQKLLRVAL